MGVDRIAGRAGHIADDDPVLPQQGVGHRRFAYVRTADEGDVYRLFVVFFIGHVFDVL